MLKMWAIVALAVVADQGIGTAAAAHAAYTVYYKESRSGLIKNKGLNCQNLDSRKSFRQTWRNVNLKLVTHGFRSSNKSVQGVKKAWLDAQAGINTRVIILDWAKISKPFPFSKDPSALLPGITGYTQAANNALDVGTSLGKCLAKLVGKGLDPNKIHLVGHSLGSHLVGKAGREFKKETGKKVGRVTGLDPAGPLWVGIHEGTKLANDRLSNTSAKFVDVIHTNGGRTGIPQLSYFGALQPLGHKDFYPDGGRDQKICNEKRKRITGKCSHSQAIEWFRQSIEDPKKFKVKKCSDYTKCTGGTRVRGEYMGEGVSKSGTGTFFVEVPTKVAREDESFSFDSLGLE